MDGAGKDMLQALCDCNMLMYIKNSCLVLLFN